MARSSDQTPPGRARLATAGARAVTEEMLSDQPRGDLIKGTIFFALLLLALAFALVGLAAIIIQAAVNGAPAFGLDLFTNGPSTINPSEAGFRPALVGTVYLILGVIVLVVPLGVGAAIYLEEYGDRDKWWNRTIELNVQNLAGVPSIIYGILGLAFIVRGPLDLGFILIAGSMTLALLVLPTVILAARERAIPP